MELVLKCTWNKLTWQFCVTQWRAWKSNPWSTLHVGAVIQHITYNEWLPIILGPRVLEIFELKLLPRGYYRGYNESVNPTISNAFAASAFRYKSYISLLIGQTINNSHTPPNILLEFTITQSMLVRFGHSLVKRSIDRCNKEFRQVPFNVELHKEMNNPSNLHNFGSVDRILLGLSSQKLSRRDEFITDELTNHLFQVIEKSKKSEW